MDRASCKHGGNIVYFIYDLFKDAASSSDYIALNDTIINE
jgi:hypothetical protein